MQSASIVSSFSYVFNRCRYEFEYGFTVSSFDSHGSMTHLQLACILIDVVCSPSAGLGFFVIFLVVQPTAYNHLAHRLHYLCGCCKCCIVGRPRSHTGGLNHNNNHNQHNSDHLYMSPNSSTYSAMRKTLSNPNLHHHFNEALLPPGAMAGAARSEQAAKPSGKNASKVSSSRSVNSKDSNNRSSSGLYPQQQSLSNDDPLLLKHPLDGGDEEWDEYLGEGQEEEEGDILDEEELAQAMEDKYSVCTPTPGGFKASGSFLFFEGASNFAGSGVGRSFSAWNGSAVSSSNGNSNSANSAMYVGNSNSANSAMYGNSNSINTRSQSVNNSGSSGSSVFRARLPSSEDETGGGTF